MASKQVVDRQKAAQEVLAGGETHLTELSSRLEAELKPYLKRGETLPDAATLVVLCLRALAQSRDELVKADAAHDAELADDAGPRESRDGAAVGVRGQLIELRALVLALYGMAGVRALELSEETPTDAMQLLRRGEAVCAALKGAKLPAPRRKGAALDAKEILGELEPEVAALRASLGDVARELREAQNTGRQRVDALAAFDRRYGRTAALLEALLDYAGLDALAERLRPSTRRSDTEEPEPEPAPPAPAPGPEGT